MKQTMKRIFTAALAVCFFTAGVPMSFAADTGMNENTSKGTEMIAATSAALQAQNDDTASSDAAAEQPQQNDENAAENGVQEAVQASESFETPEPSTAADMPEMSKSDADEYALSDYANNDILVMYQSGDVQVLHCESQEALAEKIAALKSDNTVEYFQPNFSYESDTASALTTDTYAAEQWGLANDGSFTGNQIKVKALKNADVSAEKAWKYYTPKRDVVIALVDTGVQTSHEELAGSFWTNTDEIAGNGIDDDGNGYIDDVNGWNFYNNNNKIYTGSTDDHGTHCAGTITAAKDNGKGIAGLADYSNIKIMTLKALGGSDGAGTTLSLTRAIMYAENKGATICNLSLGTENNDRLLYQVMQKSKMLFVVAAGNGDYTGRGSNIDQKASYPASYDLDNIITVGNMTAAGVLHSSSDYGTVSVDLAAPGTDIMSTATGGKYAYMTGTSMAAPFVSASAAMVYSANENLTVADVKNILMNTVKSDTLLTSKTATGGVLDCGAAVAYAVTGSTQYQEGDEDDDMTLEPEEEDTSEEYTSATPGQHSAKPDTGSGGQSGGQDMYHMPGSDFGGDPFRSISSPYDNGFFGGGMGGWFGGNFQIEIPQLFQIIRWSFAS